WISRIDDNRTDVMLFCEPGAAPRRSRIGRLKNSVTSSLFAGGGVNHLRIRSRNRNRPDRSDVHSVENRLPGTAAIHRFPHSAVRRAHVISVWLAHHASDSCYPSAAMGSQKSPA